jgi:hypothetical protein
VTLVSALIMNINQAAIVQVTINHYYRFIYTAIYSFSGRQHRSHITDTKLEARQNDSVEKFVRYYSSSLLFNLRLFIANNIIIYSYDIRHKDLPADKFP